jgi:hypothetical protein
MLRQSNLISSVKVNSITVLKYSGYLLCSFIVLFLGGDDVDFTHFKETVNVGDEQIERPQKTSLSVNLVNICLPVCLSVGSLLQRGFTMSEAFEAVCITK